MGEIRSCNGEDKTPFKILTGQLSGNWPVGKLRLRSVSIVAAMFGIKDSRERGRAEPIDTMERRNVVFAT